MDNRKNYWFPAKRYGWGWSLPTCWQGWAVLVAYAGAVALIFHFLPPVTHHAAFLAGMAMATVVLVVVCWLKGEPPAWRWGNDDRG